MKNGLIFMAFFSLAIHSKSQSVTGAFIIAKCSDGILVAADSRGFLSDPADINQVPLAYSDSVQKSFIIGKNVLVINGSGLYGNLFIKSIVDGYIKNSGTALPAAKLLESFMNFCKTHLEPAVYNQLKKNSLATAGYNGSKVNICYYKPGLDKIICADTAGFIESSKSSFSNLYKNSYTCKRMSYKAKKSIIMLGGTAGNSSASVGQPVRMIELNKTKTVWAENKPAFTWANLAEFGTAYKNKRVTVTLLSEKNKPKVENILR